VQILELELPDYRGLREFQLDLTQAEQVAVLVGRNASGKSRLLHAIVEIFSGLRRREHAGFPYRLRYSRGEHTLEVEGDTGRPRPVMRMMRPQSKPAVVRQADWTQHLPDYLFGYQAARESHWDIEFRRHAGNDRSLRRNRRSASPAVTTEDPSLAPLFQCELIHLPLILLALLPQWSEKYGPYVEEVAGITGFVSADLTISRPTWAKGAWYENQPYWGLSGRYPNLFGQLASSGRYGVLPRFSDPSSYDEFRVSIQTTEDLDALLRFFDSALNMFATFERLQAEGVLTAEIQLTKADGTRLTTDDLSSGEQQMLTILGMLRLQRGNESLFLLDEPASHFHPAWSQRWYNSVQEMLEDGQRSQFIASTHDPALVSNIPREQIRLFRRQGAKVVADVPDVDPRGRGVGALLTTELWGLATQLDEDTQKYIDEQHELAGYPDLNDIERDRLQQVSEELDKRDFANERRDPVVSLFLSELARRRQELIEAARSEAIPAAELEALVRQLFDERLMQGL